MSLTPHLLAVRLRRLLVRTRWRRALVVSAAIATGVVVTTAMRSAERALDRWGDTRTVAVARHDLAPGDVVEADDVERRELPEVAVADDALGEVPVGAVVRQPVGDGEPILASRLGPEGVTGPAALVPEGDRAVAIPIGPLGRPPLRVGDQVDVLAVIPSEAALQGHDDGLATTGAVPLVEHAPVVDVADQAVTVAVPHALTPTVAYAAAQGAVVLALTGG
jgi:Flp pilus assembly protein CpaB